MKLVDVYPDTGMADPKMNGYQLMVANEVFRGRYRKSFSRPEPLVPAAVVVLMRPWPPAAPAGRAPNR